MNQKGYITLFSILVISAIAATMTLTLVLVGVGSSRSGLVYGQSRQAQQLASACAEEALEQIKSNPAFTGSNNVTLTTGTCGYEVIDSGGQNRTVNTSGTVGQVVRRSKLLLSAVSPEVVISSWQDVSDF